MANPNLTDFLTFIRVNMGITTAQLPDASPVITDAFNFAQSWVLSNIQQCDANLYNLAFYNLGGDYILNWAPDQTGLTFFADARKAYGLNSFQAGVIQSSSDESTSESMVVQDAAKNFTIADLQQLKTPYGRWYLMIAQQYGGIWGLS